MSNFDKVCIYYCDVFCIYEYINNLGGIVICKIVLGRLMIFIGYIDDVL